MIPEMANSGSLKLEHDITPTDMPQLGVLDGTQPPTNQQHRFQGFPAGHFSDVRKPITGFIDYNSQPFDNFRKNQHFVKGLPPGLRAEIPTHPTKLTDTEDERTNERQPVEKANNGIQYGSDGLPLNRSAPTPRKTVFLLEDRTSAEEKKRVRQKREADWDISQSKQWKEMTYQQVQEEKRKDLQMLKDYRPWGRPGGGAPTNSELNFRRTRNMEDSVLGNKGELLLQYPAFGQQGHGAPLRTDSGSLKTSFRANHDIRFQHGMKNMQQNVHNKLRYTQPRRKGEEYINDLGNLALEQRTRREIEKHRELEEEKNTWKYDPYGKSGGGAPIKTDSGRALAGRQRTLVKDSYELREVEQKQEHGVFCKIQHFLFVIVLLLIGSGTGKPTDVEGYNPWGKGSGVPERDEAGNVRRYKWTDGNNVPEFVDPNVKGVSLETNPIGGGGHRVDAKGEKMTRLPQTLVHDQNSGGPLRDSHRHAEPLARDPSDVPRQPGEYNPWGRPGNGAPIIDEGGNIIAMNRGKAEQDKMGLKPPKPEEQMAKKEYLNQLKKEIEDQHHQRDIETEEIRKPATEVADWIRTKEIGYPKRDPVTRAILPVHYKQTSDVTAQRMDIRRPIGNQLEYQSDLERQAQERYQAHQAKKQESRDLSAHHHENFNRLWGRPGHGAPVDDIDHKRHTLDTEKGKQDDLSLQPPWNQPHGTKLVKKPWARTTALENRFKPDSEQNLAREEYCVRAPWASL
ncbi:uncharacterized protein LOC110987773 [Acanthaster planci]|uniref:Uncharacterized protein LOC110987773 n=1 Tax=Acanthaster planci TaxID=133434 RepID=A0A8B7ZNA2_ACAPL|nr:uncharacterized protein LOC110987773 [Acanthaster planci]